MPPAVAHAHAAALALVVTWFTDPLATSDRGPALPPTANPADWTNEPMRNSADTAIKAAPERDAVTTNPGGLGR